MDRLNESQLARMREHLKFGKALRIVRDGQSVWQWAEQAMVHLEELLEQAETEAQAEGGQLARKLREALEGRILRELHGQAALTDDTSIESLSVHVLPQGVLVDTRLKIGSWKQ